MTTKQEIALFKKARSIIKKGYGADCKDISLDCASCRAKRLIDYLDWHLGNLEWNEVIIGRNGKMKMIGKTRKKSVKPIKK